MSSTSLPNTQATNTVSSNIPNKPSMCRIGFPFSHSLGARPRQRKSGKYFTGLIAIMIYELFRTTSSQGRVDLFEEERLLWYAKAMGKDTKEEAAEGDWNLMEHQKCTRWHLSDDTAASLQDWTISMLVKVLGSGKEPRQRGRDDLKGCATGSRSESQIIIISEQFKA